MLPEHLIEPILVGTFGVVTASAAGGPAFALRCRDTAVRVRGTEAEAVILRVEIPPRPYKRWTIRILLTSRYPDGSGGTVTRPIRYEVLDDTFPDPGWTIRVKVHPANSRRAAPVGPALPPLRDAGGRSAWDGPTSVTPR